MSLPNFEDIPIITMTCNAKLNQTLDLESLFRLLPASKLEVKPSRSRKKRAPIGYDSEIVCLRYGNRIRGSDRTLSQRSFNHIIMLDMTVEGGNVSLKVGRNNIHMAGCKSQAMVQQVLTYFNQHVHRVQAKLELLTPQLCSTLIKFVSQQPLALDMDRLFLTNQVSHFLPDTFTFQDCPELPSELVTWLNDLYYQYIYFEDLIQLLIWLATGPQLCPEPYQLEAKEVQHDMVNRSFYLGFYVDRWALACALLSSGQFIPNYQNDIDRDVKITCFLATEPELEEPTYLQLQDSSESSESYEEPFKWAAPKAKKPLKRKANTFLVSEKGHVTLSATSQDHGRAVYQDFVRLILDLRPKIEKL